eukprot:CAMPEP_0179080078 /NCGR_PEP_ID=MMETSP0796-20121207/35968_1 /TAXON_ID=73915 /ORGANISM="Pyrodinium bahamense, Strain pbaha01" /LENGTH=295 /DNA_ID=CAMNT_0020777425 /DNA_START=74 /DNA_END=961 /DNA_ORIENTATION=+
MATVQQPLSARENRTLRAAGSVQVGGVTPRTRNPLLQRDDVGRARPTCYDLPDDHFAYGRPGNMDMEGAREVSMRWVSHTPSREPQGEAPDYVHYNKRAAGQKVMNAKDQKHFRREHELLGDPLLPGASPRGYHTARARYHSMNTRDPLPSDVVPGFTYGRKVRPSTPIQAVISNHFGTSAEADLGRFYADFHEAQEQSAAYIRKIPLTAASRGHALAAKKAAMAQQDKELFKMSKFRRASPKVDTRYRRPRDILDKYDEDDISELGGPLSGGPRPGEGLYEDTGSSVDAASVEA